MQFENKVLVLKCAEQRNLNLKSPSALLRIEIENGVAEMHLSLVNQPPEINAEFYLLIIDGNKHHHEFTLGKRPSSCAILFSSLPELSNGVVAGIYYAKEDIPLTLLFASEQKDFSLPDFKKLVAERCLTRFKQNQKSQSEKACSTTLPAIEYNDEAVATENYYEIDKQIRQKLKGLKETEYENLRLENELLNSECQEKAQKECAFTNSVKDETDNFVSKTNNQCAYYQKVKDELDQIFLTYPKEQALCELFKDSCWARINYEKEKYYVVGVVPQNGVQKYICYGVPATYSKQPPKELAGFCSFIPLSVFNMFGAGYWIMFQDTTTGKCVHLND